MIYNEANSANNPQLNQQDGTVVDIRQNSNQSLLPLFFLTIIIFLIGIIVFLIYQNNQLRLVNQVTPDFIEQENKVITETQNQTKESLHLLKSSDWQEYVSEKYHYSLKYPSDFSLRYGAGPISETEIENWFVIEGPYESTATLIPKNGVSAYTLEVRSEYSNKTYDTFLSDILKTFEGLPTKLVEKDQTIYVGKQYSNYNNEVIPISKAVAVKNDKNVFVVLTLSRRESVDKQVEDTSVLSEVLSTFKFGE